jgi:riboflavin synthase alpha subunit
MVSDTDLSGVPISPCPSSESVVISDVCLTLVAREGARFVADVSRETAVVGLHGLTISEVQGPRFGINLIPHTVESATFRQLAIGGRLNMEADQLTRYLERLLAQRT